MESGKRCKWSRRGGKKTHTNTHTRPQKETDARIGNTCRRNGKEGEQAATQSGAAEKMEREVQEEKLRKRRKTRRRRKKHRNKKRHKNKD
jgi:hypothetical protein